MKTELGLKDIQGLDPISAWPLAIGWWIIIAGLIIAAILVMLFFYDQKRRSLSWKSQLLKKLEIMKKTVSSENAHAIATELAEMIRRLATHRFSRKECGHLQGEAWILWLSEKDPIHYDWTKSKEILIEAPFRPSGFDVDSDLLRKTIDAVKGWVQ
jgi:hypothetical protein